jgi:hypothetical protein
VLENLDSRKLLMREDTNGASRAKRGQEAPSEGKGIMAKGNIYSKTMVNSDCD